jgi:hypothetical protein
MFPHLMNSVTCKHRHRMPMMPISSMDDQSNQSLTRGLHAAKTRPSCIDRLMNNTINIHNPCPTKYTPSHYYPSQIIKHKVHTTTSPPRPLPHWHVQRHRRRLVPLRHYTPLLPDLTLTARPAKTASESLVLHQRPRVAV